MSVDIDLFTAADYGSIDFKRIDDLFLSSFPFTELRSEGNNSIGRTYFVGNDKHELIKVDFFYTDPFVFPYLDFEGVRLSHLAEITAMKLEIIGQGGRKKDFWDLHELMEYYSVSEILEFYEKRYPYGFSRDQLVRKMLDFCDADSDFAPICLKGKYWELIKLDIEEKVLNY